MTYKIQIDDEIRDATPEEVERLEQINAEAEAKKQAQIAEATKKAADKAALLERLGITEAEANLLVN